VLAAPVSAAAIVIDLGAAGAPQSESAQFTGNLPVAGSRSEATSQTGGGTVQAPTTLQPQGYIGHYIDIFADGADLGIISGPANASVSGANAPVLATTGVAIAAGMCWRIPTGGRQSFFVTPDDRFLGVVASAAGTARITLSSR
jgi:hypothetical protein